MGVYWWRVEGGGWWWWGSWDDFLGLVLSTLGSICPGIFLRLVALLFQFCEMNKKKYGGAVRGVGGVTGMAFSVCTDVAFERVFSN